MNLGAMSTSEIVELDSEQKMDENTGKRHMLKPGHKYSIEDDINKLFEAIEIRNSGRGLSPSQVARDSLQKKSMKRPIRVGSSQASGIGISESVSLKQALRGLCISQASEMAAMKRLSKPSRLSGVSESGNIKKLYTSVVDEESEFVLPSNEGNGSLVQISLIPEKLPESQHGFKEEESELSNSSVLLEDLSKRKAKMTKKMAQAVTETVPLPAGIGGDVLSIDLEKNRKVKSTHSSFATLSSKKLSVVDEILDESIGNDDKGQNANLHSTSSFFNSKAGNKVTKSASSGSRLVKPAFKNKNFVNKKIKPESTSFTSPSNHCNEGVDNDLGPSTSENVRHTPNIALSSVVKEKDKASLASSSAKGSIEVSSSMDSTDTKPGCTSNYSNMPKIVVTKTDEKSRSREKGEFSQSSKSSIGEYSSSTTSFSEESNSSGSSRSGSRPHMSKDLRWEAIRCVQKQQGSLGLRHFKLLKKIGGGDIGTVYLAELGGTNCLFALKVMDNEFLAVRKKMPRAQTEREILQMLDHPFLPTLYVHFTTDKFSCLVMEYCPGGDLHVLRQKQPNKNFSEQAARFYVAEVLLALEYLHMLGVVYRDLKPENILVREDGHIMLSDFDLSLRCSANPTLLKSSSPVIEPPKKVSSPCTESSCIDPFCLQPTWQVPCFTPRLLTAASKARKLKSDLAAQVSPLPQVVVEPTAARSNSFVGTHEYLAPEIIKGEGHGSPVDWWTFGIFLYELLYGRTPFKGTANEDTLSNAVSQCLKFPQNPAVSSHARDLIRRLLKKEPENRLGSVKGAAEIKQHPFFEGLNWALIRCAVPPEMPKMCDFGSGNSDISSQCKESGKSTGENPVFEMF